MPFYDPLYKNIYVHSMTFSQVFQLKCDFIFNERAARSEACVASTA